MVLKVRCSLITAGRTCRSNECSALCSQTRRAGGASLKGPPFKPGVRGHVGVIASSLRHRCGSKPVTSPLSHRGRGCPHLKLCLSPSDHTDHYRLRRQDAQDLGRTAVGRHLRSDWSVLLRPASGGTSCKSSHICFETFR